MDSEDLMWGAFIAGSILGALVGGFLGADMFPREKLVDKPINTQVAKPVTYKEWCGQKEYKTITYKDYLECKENKGDEYIKGNLNDLRSK